MTAKTFLKKIGACRDSIEWVSRRSFKRAWEECPRGEWLIWAMEKLGVLTSRELVGLLGEIVSKTPLGDGRTVKALLTDARSIMALNACGDYAQGLISDNRLKEFNAYAFIAAFAADYFNTYAAHAVAYATSVICDSIFNSSYASTAIEAAARAAEYINARKWQANFIRSRVPFERVMGKVREVLC